MFGKKGCKSLEYRFVGVIMLASLLFSWRKRNRQAKSPSPEIMTAWS